MRLLAIALASLCLESFVHVTPVRANSVAFYDFEDNPSGTMLADTGSGTALDMTKAGNPPTFSTNTPTSGTGFAFGGSSLQINAPNSYAYVQPGSDAKLELQTLTVQAWVDLASASGNEVVLGYDPGGGGVDGRGYLLTIANGEILFEKGVGTGAYQVLSSGTTIGTGAWHEIAASYTSGTANIFIDGVQVATGSLPGDIVYADRPGFGPVPKSAYLGIFHNGNPSASTFDPDLVSPLSQGTLLDRLQIDDAALSAASLDYYTSGTAAPLPSSVLGGLVLLGGFGLLTARRRLLASM